MDEDKIFYLDENEQDRAKFNITYNDEGSLNLYWRGSNENYLQKLYIYGNDYKGLVFLIQQGYLILSIIIL